MELRRKQKQPMMIEIRIAVTFGLLYMPTRARDSPLEGWKCWLHRYVYVYLLCVYSMPICFIYVICWEHGYKYQIIHMIKLMLYCMSYPNKKTNEKKVEEMGNN